MKLLIRNCSTDGRIAWLIDPTKPVEVYKNLNRNCWSVRQSGVTLSTVGVRELVEN